MTSTAQIGTWQRIKRIAAIFGVFIVVGPPIGAWFFVLWWLIVGVLTDKDATAAGISEFLDKALFYAIPVGYLTLGRPMAIAGLVAGLWQAYRGQARFWMVTLVAIILGFGFQLWARTQSQPLFWGEELALFSSVIVATFFCWFVVKNWHFASPGPEATA
jgi:hypothetical protein